MEYIGYLLAAFAVLMIPILIIAAISIVISWKLFVKLGIPGWKCIVPFYNQWVFYEALGMMGWLSLLVLVPVIGPVVTAILNIFACVRLAAGFGKSSGFAIGLFLLAFIFQAILAFNKDTWDPSRIDYSAMDFVNDKSNPYVAGTAPKPEAGAAPAADAPKEEPKTAEDVWAEGK